MVRKETQPQKDLLDRVLDLGDKTQQLTVPIEVGAIGVGLAFPPLGILAAWGAAGLALDGTMGYASNAIREDRRNANNRREKPEMKFFGSPHPRRGRVSASA